MRYFNPRPPRGGRPRQFDYVSRQRIFQSTPSARRATWMVDDKQYVCDISIHALREEGDLGGECEQHARQRFQSTPSARRATYGGYYPNALLETFQSTPSARRATCRGNKTPEYIWVISIHALREEGDTAFSKTRMALPKISIHALREEGDKTCPDTLAALARFQSTPSARRATL